MFLKIGRFRTNPHVLIDGFIMIYRTIGMPMCKPWRSPKSDGQDELLLRALQSLRDGILRPQATTGGWNLWWWLMDTDGKHGESHITTMVPRGDSGRWMAFLFAFAPWVNPVTFCWKWSMVQWWIFMDFRKQFCGEILHYPIGSMYAIGNIYHQYSPNVSIYICHTWILWVRWLPSSGFSIAMFVDVPGRPKTRRSSCWHHRSEPRRGWHGIRWSVNDLLL